MSVTLGHFKLGGLKKLPHGECRASISELFALSH